MYGWNLPDSFILFLVPKYLEWKKNEQQHSTIYPSMIFYILDRDFDMPGNREEKLRLKNAEEDVLLPENDELNFRNVVTEERFIPEEN